jgi:hypothetical protein
MSSRQPTYFLSLPRKKVSKERGTRRWRSGCAGLLCGARCLGPRAQLAVFAALTPLRQTSRSQLLMRAIARGPKALRSSTPPTGTQTPDSARCASHDDASASPRARCEARCGWEVAKQRPNCSWAPWVASRSAGVWGRVRSTLRPLTSRRLSERSGRRPRSEFGVGPKARAPQSSRPMADRHRRDAFLLVPFLWRGKEKGLPCRGHIPTQPHASEQTTAKASQKYTSFCIDRNKRQP